MEVSLRRNPQITGKGQFTTTAKNKTKYELQW